MESKDTRFKPGHPGFKKKGDNGLQKEIRQQIGEFLKGKLAKETIDGIFEDASPKMKLNFIIELLPFITPKQKEFTFEDVTPPGAHIDYTKLSAETLKEILGATSFTINEEENEN